MGLAWLGPKSPLYPLCKGGFKPGGDSATMIHLTVNGKPRALEASTDLASFLASFAVNLQFVAVGYNGEVVKKERFSHIMLRQGDVLEIVRPVGGG